MNVIFNRLVMWKLPNEKSVSDYAETWGTGYVGTHGANSTFFDGFLDGLLDEFLNAYLKANQ